MFSGMSGMRFGKLGEVGSGSVRFEKVGYDGVVQWGLLSLGRNLKSRRVWERPCEFV